MSEVEFRSIPRRCRSCGAKLHGPHCSDCGENHRFARLSLAAMAEEVLDGLLNLDSRILRTIADLSLAPGAVCRDYIEGRRVGYLHPFKYALACLAVFTLVRMGLEHLHGASMSPLAQARGEVFTTWGELIEFGALPIVALFLVPLFWSAPKRLRWIEHFVVVLYSFGHIWLLGALLRPFIQAFGAAIWGQLLPVIYLSWVFVGVYESRWWTVVPRALLTWIAAVLAMISLEALVAPETSAVWLVINPRGG